MDQGPVGRVLEKRVWSQGGRGKGENPKIGPFLSQRYKRSAEENVFLSRPRAAVPSVNGENCERTSPSSSTQEKSS